jgi:hypothetical protein
MSKTIPFVADLHSSTVKSGLHKQQKLITFRKKGRTVRKIPKLGYKHSHEAFV